MTLLNNLYLHAINFSGVLSWLKEQVQIIVIIIAIVVVILSLIKGSFKLLIGGLLLAALVYYFVGTPESFLTSISQIWKMIIS